MIAAELSASKLLNPRQIAAVNRIGDVLVPGGEGFPSFSQSGCVRHVDRVLAYMPQSDLADLKMLLSLFGLMPRFKVALLMRFLEWSVSIAIPLGPIGGLLRLIRIGLRGLVMTLYYGDEAILEKLEYKVQVK